MIYANVVYIIKLSFPFFQKSRRKESACKERKGKVRKKRQIERVEQSKGNHLKKRKNTELENILTM